MGSAAGEVFLSEFMGTAVLLLLGCGVVANVALARTNGFGGGFLMINFGWGIAVFSGVYLGYSSGAHLNPAVTLGIASSGADTYVDGMPVTIVNTLIYLAAQLLGAFVGAVLAWAAHKDHFDLPENDPGTVLGVFATGPAIKNGVSNMITEILGTFVLVFVVLSFAQTPSGLGPLSVALLVVGIGASLGGPTGYAINPARDLGPRIAHQLLPIKTKGSSNWGYAWVPIAGPLVGGILAGVLANVVGFV